MGLQLLVDAFLHINLANNIFALVFTTFCSVTADLLIYIFVLWVIFRTINPLNHHHEEKDTQIVFISSLLFWVPRGCSLLTYATYQTTGDIAGRDAKTSPREKSYESRLSCISSKSSLLFFFPNCEGNIELFWYFSWRRFSSSYFSSLSGRKRKLLPQNMTWEKLFFRATLH